MRIQEKVKGIGFDWDTKAQVWAKVQEELGELQEAEASSDASEIESEFGDVLFSLINYARFIGVNPENALDKTNLKFKGRFQTMESLMLAANKNISEMDLTEMDVFWEKAKELEKNK